MKQILAAIDETAKKSSFLPEPPNKPKRLAFPGFPQPKFQCQSPKKLDEQNKMLLCWPQQPDFNFVEKMCITDCYFFDPSSWFNFAEWMSQLCHKKMHCNTDFKKKANVFLFRDKEQNENDEETNKKRHNCQVNNKLVQGILKKNHFIFHAFS